MAKGKQKDSNLSPRIENRRAYHDHFVSQKIECGLVLSGSEVKSIRNGQVQLSQGFARVENPGQKNQVLVLHGVDIALYPHAGPTTTHEPRRPRRLLAHKRQIDQLAAATSVKGTTLVPLAMYFVRGKVKVELGVASGKKAHDKRQDLKKHEAERDMRRAMTRKRL